MSIEVINECMDALNSDEESEDKLLLVFANLSRGTIYFNQKRLTAAETKALVFALRAQIDAMANTTVH